MDDIQELIELGEKVARKRGWKLSTLGLYAAGESGLFDKLIERRNITTRRRDKIMLKLQAMLDEPLKVSPGCPSGRAKS